MSRFRKQVPITLRTEQCCCHTTRGPSPIHLEIGDGRNAMPKTLIIGLAIRLENDGAEGVAPLILPQTTWGSAH